METTNSTKWLWVAVVVLALATVGFAIWAFIAQSSANSLSDEKASLQQTVSDEGTSISNADKSNAELQQQAGELKSEYEKARQKLTVDNATIKEKEQEIDQLNAKLATETKEDSSLENQLAAEKTKVELANACASWLERSLNKIYESSTNPNAFQEVTKTIEAMGAKCKGVVS